MPTPEEPFETAKKSGWRTAAIVFRIGAVGTLMVLALGAGAWFSLWFLSSSDEITVPELTGLPEDEARERAEGAGLRLEVEAERSDRRVSAGRILQQEPLAGSETRGGRTIRVVRSLGEQEVQVPSLTGRTGRESQLLLQAAGLQQGIVTTVSWNAPESTVLAQEPRPNERRPAGDRVDLLVSGGSRRRVYVMPDLSGTSQELANERLLRAGLRPKIETRPPRPGVASGVVIAQDPAAGEPVREREIVLLTVSQ